MKGMLTLLHKYTVLKEQSEFYVSIWQYDVIYLAVFLLNNAQNVINKLLSAIKTVIWSVTLFWVSFLFCCFFISTQFKRPELASSYFASAATDRAGRAQVSRWAGFLCGLDPTNNVKSILVWKIYTWRDNKMLSRFRHTRSCKICLCK